MGAAIFAFGAVILCLGGYGVVRPEDFKAMLLNWNPRTRYALAVGVRVLMGGVFVTGADATPFPLALRALGWIALLAAGVLAFLGPNRVDAMMGWWGTQSSGFLRGWCLLGIAFGAFLIWAGLAPAS